MTIIEMLQESGVLAVLGMAVVFVFLGFMVVSVNLMHKLIRILGWDNDVTQPKNELPQKTVPAEHIAAISAAVTEYRKKE